MFYLLHFAIERYALERRFNNMRKIHPLNHQGFRTSLGPGYRRGWYTPDNVGGRANGCRISRAGHRRFDMTRRYSNIIRHLRNGRSLESIRNDFEFGYHGEGHLIIAYYCISQPFDYGVMGTASTSARDPIFYRWHLRIDQVAQRFMDRLPRL